MWIVKERKIYYVLGLILDIVFVLNNSYINKLIFIIFYKRNLKFIWLVSLLWLLIIIL